MKTAINEAIDQNALLRIQVEGFDGNSYLFAAPPFTRPHIL